MKVILSIDPVRFPLTGIGRYTLELAKGLQAANLDHLAFLRRFRLQDDLPVLQDENPMGRQPSWKAWAQKQRLAVAIHRQMSTLLKSRALRGYEDHLFHGPNYYLPRFGGRSIVTIHDLSPYLWTESHPRERVRYLQAEIELSLKRAAAIITDTEYTRREVADFFGWPLDRIHAAPLACSENFHPRADDEIAPSLLPYGLTPKTFTFGLGTIEPRKNLETLIEAYSGLDATLRQSYPLVLAGYTGWKSEKLHDKIKAAESAGWLRYLGFVPESVLPILLAGARLFAFPSLYEGFGLPVLEAMASGVPVISSNAATLPEVASDAAAFHEPRDVDALRALLAHGLEDAAWRDKAAQAGLMRAKEFSWAACTAKTIAAYRAVLNG